MMLLTMRYTFLQEWPIIIAMKMQEGRLLDSRKTMLVWACKKSVDKKKVKESYQSGSTIISREPI